jgi:hypothetical protein
MLNCSTRAKLACDVMRPKLDRKRAEQRERKQK